MWTDMFKDGKKKKLRKLNRQKNNAQGQALIMIICVLKNQVNMGFWIIKYPSDALWEIGVDCRIRTRTW